MLNWRFPIDEEAAQSTSILLHKMENERKQLQDPENCIVSYLKVPIEDKVIVAQ